MVAVEPIAVTLQVTPSDLDARTIPALMVTGTITNVGDDAIDVRLHESDLYIDGQASWAWQQAIGNGARDPLESSLPPGATLEFGRNMGASLFRASGTYSLKLRVLGVESPPVTVSLSAQGGDEGHGEPA